MKIVRMGGSSVSRRIGFKHLSNILPLILRHRDRHNGKGCFETIFSGSTPETPIKTMWSC